MVLQITLWSYGQRQISNIELRKIKAKIEKDAMHYKDSLNERKDVFTSNYEIEFKCDAYKVRELRKRRISIDWTTVGMSKAVYDEERAYDSLLNKYYQVLLSKLTAEDQLKLRESQRNWLKFRDSERELNGIISKDEYSGGGTIQSNLRAAGYCEITEKRLFEIVAYLEWIME